jgi:hypothetical protein
MRWYLLAVRAAATGMADDRFGVGSGHPLDESGFPRRNQIETNGNPEAA